ncbi:MAG TPA: hypothetical protein ENF76_05880 [Candidatus Bathyarchaeota archaeon]|nr:hypothetical protein [Candidatus Bathyarchaeota archaeon]
MANKVKYVAVAVIIIAIVIAAAVYFFYLPKPAETIKIGLTTPLSSPGDYKSGEINKKTAELAIKHINEEGGVLGKNLSLVVADDQGKVDVGVSAVERLITEENVVAIVGIWHSSVALAQKEKCIEYGVPIFAHYTWADDFTADHSEWVFRVSPYNSEIAKLILPYIVDEGYEHVAVMAEDTDYGLGFANAFKTEAEAEGINVTIVEFPYDATDLRSQLTELKNMANPPDLLLIASVYEAGYVIPVQAYEVGLAPDCDIMAGWDYPGWSPEWWETTGEYGVNVTYPTFYHPEKLSLTSIGQKFRNDYKAEYGSEPPIYAYFLYDEIQVIAQAIKEAGSEKPADWVPLVHTMSFEGTTGTITFERETTEGSPVWNQWLGHQIFIIKLTEQGQTTETGVVVYPKE